MEDFNSILKKKIDEKQNRYNNLLANLSAGALPAPILNDIGKEMKTLKAEIEYLRYKHKK